LDCLVSTQVFKGVCSLGSNTIILPFIGTSEDLSALEYGPQRSAKLNTEAIMVDGSISCCTHSRLLKLTSSLTPYQLCVYVCVCVCVCVCTHSLSLYLAIFDTKLTFQSLRLKGEGLFSSVNILLSNGKHTTLLTGFLLHGTPIKFKAKHDSTTDLESQFISALRH